MDAMSNPTPESDLSGKHWCNVLGFSELIKTFKLAVFPSRLLWATLAVVIIVIWGSVLDFLWLQMERGVSSDAIARYVNREAELTPEPVAQQGIYAHWVTHEMVQVNRLTWDSLRLRLISGVLPAIQEMARGLLWMVTRHPVFALLFWAGALAIVSLLGGVISREAALDFSRGEKIPPKAGLEFVKSRVIDFLSAIGFPLVLAVGFVILLSILGWIMAIPWLGDVLTVVLFPMALLLGTFVVLIGFGLPTFGNLLIPTIAVEGTDAMDAFGRSFNFILAKPLRALFYAAILVLYGAFSWVVIRALVFLLLWSAHFGLSLFAGNYLPIRSGFAELNGFFLPPSLAAFYPNGWDVAGASESMGAFLIKLFVGILVCGVWGFALSFYFSACTVTYFLLRKACDWSDFDDVYVDETRAAPVASATSPPAPAPNSGVSLPVVGSN